MIIYWITIVSNQGEELKLHQNMQHPKNLVTPYGNIRLRVAGNIYTVNKVPALPYGATPPPRCHLWTPCHGLTRCSGSKAFTVIGVAWEIWRPLSVFQIVHSDLHVLLHANAELHGLGMVGDEAPASRREEG